ncbi:unnamed protein product, partial [Meganyctiphanes norvegica]
MRRKKKIFLCVILPLTFLMHLFWYQIIDETFVELKTCPACYGRDLCSNLIINEDGKHSIQLSGFSSLRLSKMINIKNVFYAFDGNEYLVLKKLAHDAELTDFDNNLCTSVGEAEGCDVALALKRIVKDNNEDIFKIIKKNPKLFENSDALRCNHNNTVNHLYKKFKRLNSGMYELHNFLTLLAVNIEPLISMAFNEDSPFFPQHLGSCGRLISEEYIGPTLSDLSFDPWMKRAEYARQLLNIVEELTKENIHLYLTDVSTDNFAVDKSGTLKIIDAENIVLVDSLSPNMEPIEHENEGIGCKDCLSYSFEDLCSHRDADHNYFAVCKLLFAFLTALPEKIIHSLWLPKNYTELFPLHKCNVMQPEYRRHSASLKMR